MRAPLQKTVSCSKLLSNVCCPERVLAKFSFKSSYKNGIAKEEKTFPVRTVEPPRVNIGKEWLAARREKINATSPLRLRHSEEGGHRTRRLVDKCRRDDGPLPAGVFATRHDLIEHVFADSLATEVVDCGRDRLAVAVRVELE